jgi:hypothetical protein
LREQHDDETTLEECKAIARQLMPLDEEVCNIALNLLQKRKINSQQYESLLLLLLLLDGVVGWI